MVRILWADLHVVPYQAALHATALSVVLWIGQAKNEQILELEHALMSAEDALEQRQATLVECQDMLAEMQSFSETQQHRAEQEQAQAQVDAQFKHLIWIRT